MRAGAAVVGCVILAACGGEVVSHGASAPPVAVVTSATVAVGAGPTARTPGGAVLRGIDRLDLPSAVADLDGVAVDPTRPARPELGPWVTIRGGMAGYVDPGGALVADLGGDGVNEVVVPLRAAPGEPPSGLLVLGPTETGPEVVGDVDFYRVRGSDVRVSAEYGELVVRHRVGAGWEPPCCLSGEVTRRFRLVDRRLVGTGGELETGNPLAQGPTVDRFYRLAGGRDLDGAYRLLTAAERQRMAAGQWPALLGQTEEVTVSILPAPRPDGLLPFRLAARSGTRSQAWQGGAGLVYDTSSHGWLIDFLTLQPEPV